MEKRILFIKCAEEYISKGISDNLSLNGFEVIEVQADADAIRQISNKPELVFLNVDLAIKTDSQFLDYLRELCMSENKVLSFAGYMDDIETVLTRIPKKNVGLVFDRPITINDISCQIEKLIENAEQGESKKHVLVVDDSGMFLRTLQQILEPYYQVSVVNSATSALGFLSINKPDLILLDYEMPVCSGPQFFAMIKAEPKLADIPVIFLTSKDDMESVRSVLALKPQGYLLKTLEPEKLLKSLEDFFAKSE